VSATSQTLIQAVIPTARGREHLLADAVRSLERHGIRPVVVEGSRTACWGWEKGLRDCTSEYVILAADDVEIADCSALAVAMSRADVGLVVSPVVVNPDGSLQGAGGYGLRMEDGGIARNALFPFARRETLELFVPWPGTSHYCDCWISEHAWRLGRGPIVTHGFTLVHKISSPKAPDARPTYERWRSSRLEELGYSRRERNRGCGYMVKVRLRTEFRLLSAGGRQYLIYAPGRFWQGLRRRRSRKT
jgi:hypothetical protein